MRCPSCVTCRVATPQLILLPRSGVPRWFQVEYDQALYITHIRVELEAAHVPQRGALYSMEVALNCWKTDGPKHTRIVPLTYAGQRRIFQVGAVGLCAWASAVGTADSAALSCGGAG